MSRKVKLKPTLADNEISIASNSKSINFKLCLRTVGSRGKKTAVELIAGAETNVFVALFDDKDIDFEIVVRNPLRQGDLWLEITYDRIHKFIIYRGNNRTYRTLEDNGHRLRFLTPNRPKGQTFADIFPSGLVDSDTNIQIISNKIGFGLDFGRMVRDSGWSSAPKRPKKKADGGGGDQITLKIRIKKSVNIVWVTVDRHQTIDELKRLIEDKTEISAGRQRLVFGGKDLEDTDTIEECELEDKSAIMLFRITTGKQKKQKKTAAAERQIYIKNEKIYSVSRAGNGCAGGGGDESHDVIGDSGALGFGTKVRAHFGGPQDFLIHRKYKVESFQIDLRLKKSYAPHAVVNGAHADRKPLINATNGSVEDCKPSTSGGLPLRTPDNKPVLIDLD